MCSASPSPGLPELLLFIMELWKHSFVLKGQCLLCLHISFSGCGNGWTLFAFVKSQPLGSWPHFQCGYYQLMHLLQDLCYPFFQVLCTSQNIPQSSIWTKGVCLFRPSPPPAPVPLAIPTALLSNLFPVCSDPASRMAFLNPFSPHFFPLKTLLGLLLPPSTMEGGCRV